jgi:flavin-binding protein dodecin
MQDHVYKTTELVGTSDKGIEDAVQKAVGRAAKTVRNMRQWQAILKISFTLED